MGRLLQFFYSANGSWQVFQQLFLSTSDAGILGIRLYPEILEIFQSLPGA
jgi:hypothetical protein